MSDPKFDADNKGNTTKPDPDEDLDQKVVLLFGDQVRRPKDPIEELIKTFNEKYAAITIGGTFWILKEEKEEVDFMTRKAFIEKHENFKVPVENRSPNGTITTKETPATKVWLESQKRRTYDGMVFDLSGEVGGKIYNTYKGFVTKGVDGDCSLTLQYIHDIICNKDEAKYKKFMQFWAHMRQKPWEKVEYAIVLVGDKGVGKTFFLDLVDTLVDGRRTFKRRSRHCYRTSNAEDIFGRFRDHLQSRLALGLEEVTWGGDKRHVGTLNDYITGSTIKAEKKNGPILDLNNVMRILMTANPGWVIPATADDRRYEVYRVSNERQQDHEYFGAIKEELDNGGYEALMWRLEKWDMMISIAERRSERTNW